MIDFSNHLQEPESLLPQRSCDHRITLVHSADPVTIRPYRYPQAHKDEIEQQCDSMLALGIIRPSCSSYSFPVLLVLKHDQLWHFYIDYRELNAKTVKDKFPILVIEELLDELLDELHGALYFTKLDLCSRYHHIQIHPDDVESIKPHHGHFEFLVMPFGICNALLTYQSLMNEVFGPMLCKFVLFSFLMIS